jgi:hypothetical protein
MASEEWAISGQNFIEFHLLANNYARFEVFTVVSQHLSNTFLARVISSTIKLEVTRSSEMSVYIKPTRRHIPEDGILHAK